MNDNLELIEDTYYKFKKASGKPFRQIKNFEKYVDGLSDNNKYNLILITKYFETKWSNIDKYKYFETGFKLYNSRFSYHKFFDPKILDLYIEIDKSKKLNEKLSKENIIKSIKFAINYLKHTSDYNKNMSLLVQYSNLMDGKLPCPIKHYLNGNICAYFLVYLINKGYFKANNYETYISNINSKFYELSCNINQLKDFFVKIEEKLNEYK